MMSNEDYSRGSQMQQGRKPYQPKYQDNRYSPSSNYNYGYSQNQQFNGQGQHPRRRVDRFRRESLNYNDRLARQNDIIIRLLKEIRDRLPAPATPTVYGSDIEATSAQPAGTADTVERNEANGVDPSAMSQDGGASENEFANPEDNAASAPGTPHQQED